MHHHPLHKTQSAEWPPVCRHPDRNHSLLHKQVTLNLLLCRPTLVTRRKDKHLGLHPHATAFLGLIAQASSRTLPMSATQQLLCLDPLKQTKMKHAADMQQNNNQL
jgi:hypothetical protein